MRILVDVQYLHDKRKYWQQSCLKNIVVSVGENEKIHDRIAEIIGDNDGIKLCHKNKPQGNIYRDTSDGHKVVGYVYRCSTSIFNEGTRKWTKVIFDAWVEIHKVVDFDFEQID